LKFMLSCGMPIAVDVEDDVRGSARGGRDSKEGGPARLVD